MLGENGGGEVCLISETESMRYISGQQNFTTIIKSTRYSTSTPPPMPTSLLYSTLPEEEVAPFDWVTVLVGPEVCLVSEKLNEQQIHNH